MVLLQRISFKYNSRTARYATLQVNLTVAMAIHLAEVERSSQIKSYLKLLLFPNVTLLISWYILNFMLISIDKTCKNITLAFIRSCCVHCILEGHSLRFL